MKLPSTPLPIMPNDRVNQMKEIPFLARAVLLLAPPSAQHAADVVEPAATCATVSGF
jgi:hypothetical protein